MPVQKRTATDENHPPGKRRSSTPGLDAFFLSLTESASEPAVHRAMLPVASTSASKFGRVTSFAVRKPRVVSVCLSKDRVLGFGMVTNVHGRVTSILPGTSAEAAGLRAFDRIIEINGAPMVSDEHGAFGTLAQALKSTAETTRLTVERPPEAWHSAIAEKENSSPSSPYATRPQAASNEASRRAPAQEDGATAATLPGGEQRRVVVSRAKGERLGLTLTRPGTLFPYLLTEVALGGPADRAGLMVGDVIVTVDGIAIKRALGELLGGSKAKLRDATHIVLGVRRLALDEMGGSPKVSLSDSRVATLSADL